MRKVRVIVEVEVPDSCDLNEHGLVWLLYRRLAQQHQKYTAYPKLPYDGKDRKMRIKEYSRVVEYAARKYLNERVNRRQD